MQIKYFSLFWVVNKRADPLQMTFQGQHHSCWHLMGVSYVPVAAWAGNTHSFIQQTSVPFMHQALLWMLEMQQWVNRENSVLLELDSGEGMMISRQTEQSIRCVRWWNEADTEEGKCGVRAVWSRVGGSLLASWGQCHDRSSLLTDPETQS